MKKAFTLIELVAVIILIGVIGLITTPIITNTINKNKESLYQSQLVEIKEAASKWAYNNLDLLPSIDGQSISVTLLDLKKAGFLTIDLRDPRDGTLLPNDMVVNITYKNNQYVYDVDEESGTDINNEYNANAPTIVLNGSNIIYVEINSEYEELGASAKNNSGNTIAVNIQYKENDTEIASITTNQYKTFTVVYSATDTVGGTNYTSYIIRTVVIRDTTAPNLTIPYDIEITRNQANSFNLLTGASATDNSGETINIETSGYDTLVGKHIVSYTACDSHNNCVTKKRIVTIGEIDIFDIAKGVNRPQLTSGMTPIKWVNGVETVTTADDSSWYDYSNKLWANAKTADGSYWVWIPRYAYKISTGWHTSTAGTIDIIFLKKDTTENSSSETIQTSDYSITGTNTSNAYFLEPAFQNETGNTKYGFWVAKFEMSNTTSLPKSVPNVSSLRSITIGNMYTYSQNMSTNTSYGWSNVDTHMMTNYEWGAVAYLSWSIYGKNSEVWINNSSTYITGCAGSSVSASNYSGCQNAYNTATGQNASTTGNITGIYDMSGGAYEYTAAYVNNGNSNLSAYGSNILSSTINKNVYSITTDSQANNYDANKNVYGDAVYETSSTGSGTGWNSDYSYMPNSSSPWFIRGGIYNYTSSAGVFYFSIHNGDANGYYSFRLVVLPIQ